MIERHIKLAIAHSKLILSRKLFRESIQEIVSELPELDSEYVEIFDFFERWINKADSEVQKANKKILETALQEGGK